jgi:hypothetical protein
MSKSIFEFTLIFYLNKTYNGNMKKLNESKTSIIFILVFVISLLILTVKPNQEGTNSIEGHLSKLDFGNGKDTLELTGEKEFEAGTYEYKTVVFKKGKMKVRPSQNPSFLEIKATERITVENNFVFDLNGVGYEGNKYNEEMVSAGRNNDLGGSGGALGGAGGSGDCRSANEKKPAIQNNESIIFGQGGGYSRSDKASYGGAGDGYIRLTAPEIIIRGQISANGTGGAHSGGGGSGGKVVVVGNVLDLAGKISATGGDGSSGQLQASGGGSGGVIFLAGILRNQGALEVAGGRGGRASDLYTGCDGGVGEEGKIIKAKS